MHYSIFTRARVHLVVNRLNNYLKTIVNIDKGPFYNVFILLCQRRIIETEPVTRLSVFNQTKDEAPKGNTHNDGSIVKELTWINVD